MPELIHEAKTTFYHIYDLLSTVKSRACISPDDVMNRVVLDMKQVKQLLEYLAKQGCIVLEARPNGKWGNISGVRPSGLGYEMYLTQHASFMREIREEQIIKILKARSQIQANSSTYRELRSATPEMTNAEVETILAWMAHRNLLSFNVETLDTILSPKGKRMIDGYVPPPAWLIQP